MRTKEMIQNDINNLEVEKRSFIESVKNGTGKFNKEEAESKLSEFTQKRSNLEKEFAELSKPEGGKTFGISNRDFLESAKQNRSLTIGENGKVEQVKELFETINEKEGVLSLLSIDYVDNASINIPILEPSLKNPSDVEEGGTIAEDDEASMATTEIQPLGLASLLGVTKEALELNTVDIASKLPELFNKAFRKVIHSKILTGTLSGAKGVKGIWTSASENATNAKNTTTIAGSSITCSELAGLALQVSGYDEDFAIVMNPATYQGVLADSTDGEDVKLYKQSLITSKEIEGVKIILDAKAPATKATGSVLAVAVPLSRFHLAIAGNVTVDPIKVKGDTKTYFQAEIFVGGKQVTDSDLFALAVA